MNVLLDTHEDRMNMHMAKALDMLTDDLTEQTMPGILHEMLGLFFENLPIEQQKILANIELGDNILKGARDEFLNRVTAHSMPVRPDTRTWFEKLSDGISSAAKSLKAAFDNPNKIVIYNNNTKDESDSK